jgi:hypothetical protein
MLFQASADFYFRVAGGFVNASMSRVSALPRPVELLTHPTRERGKGFDNYVHAAGVGAVIVEQGWAEPWTKVFDHLGLPKTSVGGVIIYRIPPPK